MSFTDVLARAIEDHVEGRPIASFVDRLYFSKHPAGREGDADSSPYVVFDILAQVPEYKLTSPGSSDDIAYETIDVQFTAYTSTDTATQALDIAAALESTYGLGAQRADPMLVPGFHLMKFQRVDVIPFKDDGVWQCTVRFEVEMRD